MEHLRRLSRTLRTLSHGEFKTTGDRDYDINGYDQTLRFGNAS